MNVGNKGRSQVYLAAVLCVLVLAGSPAAALAGGGASRSSAAGQATCASRTTVGALGQEGGLLSLRGHDESARAVAAIIRAKGYSLQLVHAGGQGGYVAYVGSECLGVDGGLMAGGN